ncbi:MAG: hypothetical protein HOV81_42135 [Kofleriaceae bacterium]|nr:hypothetical protein [Kofleriaceae bacterium]
MQCVEDDALARDAARQSRLADLVVDPRWRYTFKLITPTYVPLGPSEPRFVGVVPAARMRDAAWQTLSSDNVTTAMFSISKKDSLDHAHFDVRTGRDATPSVSIRANARWRVPEGTDVDTAGAAWVELQHEIVETLGAKHGVIVTATNEYVLNAEVWLSLTSVDGKVMHPRPNEISSYAVRSRMLGNEYVRHPRWGTYLKAAHVAAVGGRDKILDIVKPAVVRDVGDLLYIQLTERVSEATSDVAKARYRAFAELLAPITVPPE